MEETTDNKFEVGLVQFVDHWPLGNTLLKDHNSINERFVNKQI